MVVIPVCGIGTGGGQIWGLCLRAFHDRFSLERMEGELQLEEEDQQGLATS